MKGSIRQEDRTLVSPHPPNSRATKHGNENRQNRRKKWTIEQELWETSVSHFQSGWGRWDRRSARINITIMQKEYDQNHWISCLRQWWLKAGFPALGECSLAVHRKRLKLQQSVNKAGCPKEEKSLGEDREEPALVPLGRHLPRMVSIQSQEDGLFEFLTFPFTM